METTKTKQQQQQPAATTRFNPMDSLADAREALVGIPTDFAANNGTVYEILTRNNRLRGLGTLLVLIAIFAAVSEILH